MDKVSKAHTAPTLRWRGDPHRGKAGEPRRRSLRADESSLGQLALTGSSSSEEVSSNSVPPDPEPIAPASARSSVRTAAQCALRGGCHFLSRVSAAAAVGTALQNLAEVIGAAPAACIAGGTSLLMVGGVLLYYRVALHDESERILNPPEEEGAPLQMPSKTMRVLRLLALVTPLLGVPALLYFSDRAEGSTEAEVLNLTRGEGRCPIDRGISGGPADYGGYIAMTQVWQVLLVGHLARLTDEVLQGLVGISRASVAHVFYELPDGSSQELSEHDQGVLDGVHATLSTTATFLTVYALKQFVPALSRIDGAMCVDEPSLGVDLHIFLSTLNETTGAGWQHVAAALVTAFPRTFRMDSATSAHLRRAARAPDEPRGLGGRMRHAADRAALRMMAGAAGADSLVVLSNLARKAGFATLASVLMVAGMMLHDWASRVRRQLTGEAGPPRRVAGLNEVVTVLPEELAGSDTSGSD